MPKSKLSAVLSLLLVFVSGALVGVLAHRAYITSAAPANASQPRGRRDPADFRKHYIQEMRDRIKLDDRQVVQVNRILDDVDAEMRQHNQNTQKALVDRINSILRPDQHPLYDQWRAEREAERQRRMKLRQQQPPDKK